jgi:hypothetical protein
VRLAEPPASCAGRVVCRGEPPGLLAQVGGCRGSAAGTLGGGGAIESRRDRGAGLRGGERLMAPALGVVVHERRQTAVQVSTRERAGLLVRPRREQRVGEAHALAVDLEHARLEGGAQGVLTPGRGHGQRERRPRQRGDHRQRRSRRRRQRREPLADHLAQPRGHRRQVRLAAPFGVRARQFEREEGVAARYLVNPPQTRATERDPQPRVQHRVQRSQAQRREGMERHALVAVEPQR